MEMNTADSNAVVSRHKLSNAEAVVCADGSASLLNVVYQGSEYIKGNGTCPHPLSLSDEAQMRYDAYPQLVDENKKLRVQLEHAVIALREITELPWHADVLPKIGVQMYEKARIALANLEAS
jgi:hypothetical protein